jgi:DNA repair protein RecO (recombination protein O)
MFTHYRSSGFVLAKKDRGESDQLFTIFTRNFGKVEVLAKAVRKITSKLRPGIELFYFSEIAFIQGRVYKTLTDVVLVDKLSYLRRNLEHLVLAYKIAEVFDKLITGQEKDEALWHLLQETFGKLNRPMSEPADRKMLYRFFLGQLSAILGYGPNNLRT